MVKRQTEQLPGLESPKPDLASRNAFGRVPKPEYFGIEPNEFADVTPIEHAAISPDRCFVERLYGGQGDRAVHGLALNATEYQAIVRSPGAFVTAIEATTERARQIDPNRDRRGATVSRSIDHAKLSKAERATKILTGLESENVTLRRLLKEIATPGYAHMSEADMRMHAETARTSFDNLLDVVGHQAKWSPEQRERAERAMNSRLFDTNYKEAFSFWRQMTDVSAQYTQRKIILFKQQRRQLEVA